MKQSQSIQDAEALYALLTQPFVVNANHYAYVLRPEGFVPFASGWQERPVFHNHQRDPEGIPFVNRGACTWFLLGGHRTAYYQETSAENPDYGLEGGIPKVQAIDAGPDCTILLFSSKEHHLAETFVVTATSGGFRRREPPLALQTHDAWRQDDTIVLIGASARTTVDDCVFDFAEPRAFCLDLATGAAQAIDLTVQDEIGKLGSSRPWYLESWNRSLPMAQGRLLVGDLLGAPNGIDTEGFEVFTNRVDYMGFVLADYRDNRPRLLELIPFEVCMGAISVQGIPFVYSIESRGALNPPDRMSVRQVVHNRKTQAAPLRFQGVRPGGNLSHFRPMFHPVARFYGTMSQYYQGKVKDELDLFLLRSEDGIHWRVEQSWSTPF